MSSICEKELLKKYSELSLKFAKENIILESDKLNDYLLMVNCKNNKEDTAKIKIYYSPKKKTYKISVAKASTKEFEKKINQLCIESEFSLKELFKTKYISFVDGSFMNNTIGYGAAIFDINGNNIKEIYGKIDNEDAKSMRQIAGEVTGAVYAIRWCKENNVDEITICYDYEGIHKWGADIWKANNDVTKAYKKFVMTCGIKITWFKIKSHTNNFYNDIADELAKKGTEC